MKEISQENPECFKWKVWEGPEIEGYTDIGVRTLFIREASRDRILEIVGSTNYSRIWFCDEYKDLDEHWLKQLCILVGHTNLNFGVTYENYFSLTKFVRDTFPIYIQINNITLKPGDHIKVGKLYSEESFKVSSGHKAKPALYNQDIKID